MRRRYQCTDLAWDAHLENLRMRCVCHELLGLLSLDQDDNVFVVLDETHPSLREDAAPVSIHTSAPAALENANSMKAVAALARPK